MGSQRTWTFGIDSQILLISAVFSRLPMLELGGCWWGIVVSTSFLSWQNSSPLGTGIPVMTEMFWIQCGGFRNVLDSVGSFELLVVVPSALATHML